MGTSSPPQHPGGAVGDVEYTGGVWWEWLGSRWEPLPCTPHEPPGFGVEQGTETAVVGVDEVAIGLAEESDVEGRV